MLTTAARETTFRSGAMASRLAQLTVVDCVFVGVAQRTYATDAAGARGDLRGGRADRLGSATGRRGA